MLKAFLDRYGSNGLARVLAVPVMTGGLGRSYARRRGPPAPVLVELGATVPARGLYVTESEHTDVDAAIAGWVAAAVPLIRVLAGYGASEV
jgi:FMN reductase